MENEFKSFYKENYKKYFWFAYKRVGNFEDAEEIVAESFSAIWQNWDNIDKDKNFKSYTFRICLNKLNDFLRRKYNLHLELVDTEILESEVYQGLQVEDSKPKKSILKNLVEDLSDREKKLIELKYVSNYSFSEIAKELNITKQNAKVINNRIIKKLKQKWNDQINSKI